MKKKDLSGMSSDETVVCDECGKVPLMVKVKGSYYVTCDCGDALELGDEDSHWIPEKWK